MKRTKQIVVTKRDGTLERFSLTKVSNCLARVMHERAYDPWLAAPLAKAVALHLQDWQECSLPTTGYIYRCVRSVLQQTGLSDVADELTAHRQRRRAQRARVQVVDAGQMDGGGEPWRKSALIETLQNRYGLRHAVSRFMAGQIEARVFALDYRRVSKAFLAELVRNEVLAWGVADDRVLGTDRPTSRPPQSARQPKEEN